MPSQSDHPKDADVPAPDIADNAYTDKDDGGSAYPPASVPTERLPRVRTHTIVFIESWAHAAELVVVNCAYAVVAKGVGTLALKLEPGSYQVRQRIGYSEHVQDLEVPPPEGLEPHWVTLPQFEFPSPIPLLGTALVTSDMELRPFSLGSGNFRFVLWSPPEDGEVSRELPLERMVAELTRLRLESFDGKASHRLGDMYVLDEKQRALVIGVELPPGPYLVIQTMTEGARQLCMPVVVLQDRITAVFCLALSHDGEPISIQLGHAAQAILRADEANGEYVPSLFRLEAARKALGAGRRSYGWSVDFRARRSQTYPDNVLLSLLDAQLAWKSRKPGSYDPTEPLSAQLLTLNDGYHLHQNLEMASAALDDMRTDVIALYGPGAFDGSMPSLKAPPLLKRSWDQLLATDEGNKRAGELMAFSFQAEPSPTWFLWSEVPGERAASFDNASSKRWLEDYGHEIILDAPASDGVFDGAVARDGAKAITLSPLKALVGIGLRAIVDFVRPPLLRKRLNAPTAAVVVTLNDVVGMLAALLQNKEFQEWLNKAQTAYEKEGKVIKDESMRRLIAGLRSLADPKLVEMLGAEAIAEQVLASLRLPQSRVVPLVKALLNDVVTRLAGQDKKAILAVLHGALDIAETWLLAPPKEPPKQP